MTNMTKKYILPLTALVVCTVLLLIACGSALSNVYQESRAVRTGQLRPAVSYDEVLATILSASEGGSAGGMRFGAAVNSGAAVDMAMPTAPTAAAPAEPELAYAPDSGMTPSVKEDYASGEQEDFSSTNVQVEGVDEADIVKTDGVCIYALYDNELRIYSAEGADSALMSTVGLWYEDADNGSRSAQEMYLYEDRVAVVCSDWCWNDERGSESRTSLVLLDVSDPESPELLDTLGQDGYYEDSRLANGILCLISDHSVWYWNDGVTPADPVLYVPALYRNDKSSLMPAESIWLPEKPSGSAYTVLTAIDLTRGERLSAMTLLDHTDTVYMDGESVYLCASHSDQTESEPYSERQYTVTDYASVSSTTVTAFDLGGDGLTLRASGAVPGSLLNQFSLDASDGYLRLAVTQRESSWHVYVDENYDFTNYRWDDTVESNGLFILDEDMQIVGSLTGLGEDEQIYSVRFDGDICYFVTFRQTDPLFAADLSDPAHPVILSELKLPGFSSYLHVYGDGLLFGLGQWADEETGWTEGMKLSMYDSTDPEALTELATLRLPEIGWSPALSDHKALLILPEKNLIGFAYDGGYLVFAWEDGDFVRLADLEGSADEWGWWDCWNARALLIRDDLYLVSSGGMVVYETQDYERLCGISAMEME